MELLFKRLLSKWYHLVILLKGAFVFRKERSIVFHSIKDLQTKSLNFTKIVSVAGGPSTSSLQLNSSSLYITTNDAYQLFKGIPFLFYVNDGFYIKKLLASHSSMLNPGQDLLFWFESTDLHKPIFKFLESNLYLLKSYKIYLISNLCDDITSQENFSDFYGFFEDKKLEVKIQNSGVFLLLFGYYLAEKSKMPFEVYGLDLGIGGTVHFNNKGVVGKSVINDRVKKNVSTYLHSINSSDLEFKNQSYFKGY
jgi:hypothetical protein